jgi:RNA-directed DNA polymerase
VETAVYYQRNLQKINRICRQNMTDDDIWKCAMSRLGWYAKETGNVINFLISPKLLSQPNAKTGRPGLVDSMKYYLRKL